jgi:V/A-type H+-transporting ATPase subunit E
MNDQLQDLLTKVYDEGVAKANAEADRILEKAKADAQKIVEEAKAKAEATTQEAEKKAAELKKNTEGDLKMAGNHTMSALKQKITELVLSATVDKAGKASFEDAEFVKSLIKDTLAGWKQDASLSLAENLKANLDEAFMASLKTVFSAKLDIDFNPQIKAGFTISPADGSYKLSFTDQDFSELFKHYLRPRTAKILFES